MTVSMLGSSVDTSAGPCVFVGLDRNRIIQSAREARENGQKARVATRSLKVAGHKLVVYCVVFGGLKCG